jgi:hypothetical protein
MWLFLVMSLISLVALSAGLIIFITVVLLIRRLVDFIASSVTTVGVGIGIVKTFVITKILK